MTTPVGGSGRENPMEDAMDLSDFKNRTPKASPPASVINEVAAQAGFHSRPVLAPAEAVSAPAPTPTPVAVEKAAPAPAAPAAEPLAPWADLTGIEVVNLLYKLPPDVVAKMDWVIDNVPRMNRQRIVRDAVVAHLDALIAQHYKP